MPSYAIVQAAENSSAASGTTSVSTFTNPVAAGNSIVVIANYDSSGGAATITVTDDFNAGNYGTVKKTVTAAGDEELQLFVKDNSTAGDASHKTVTVTFSASRGYKGHLVVEVSGLATPSYDTGVGQSQTAPGSGADAITTTNLTPSSANSVLFGTCLASVLPTSSATPAAGTGFTGADVGILWADDGNMGVARERLEYKLLSSTSPVAATFTAAPGTSGPYVTMAFTLLLAAGAAATVPPQRRQVSESNSTEELLFRRRALTPPSGPPPVVTFVPWRRPSAADVLTEEPLFRLRKRTPDSVDQPVLTLWVSLEEPRAEEPVQRRRVGVFAQPTAPLTLQLSGGGSFEAHGATGRSGAHAGSGARSDQPVGAATSLRAAATSGAPSAEVHGAPARTSVNTLSSSGRQSEETRGSPALRALSSLPGRSADSSSGAQVQARGLSQAGARAQERVGAVAVASRLSPSGAASLELHGATRSFVGLTFTGHGSGEAHGRIVLANLLTLSPSSRGSDEAHGSATQRRTFTGAGVASAEFRGAPHIGNILAVSPSGGASQEAHGAGTSRTTLVASGGRSDGPGGADRVLSGFTLAGARSGEYRGAPVLFTGLVLSSSGAVSQEARGAGRILSRLSPSASSSEARGGALRVGTFLAIACATSGGASLETHGAIAVVIGMGFRPAPPSRASLLFGGEPNDRKSRTFE